MVSHPTFRWHHIGPKHPAGEAVTARPYGRFPAALPGLSKFPAALPGIPGRGTAGNSGPGFSNTHARLLALPGNGRLVHGLRTLYNHPAGCSNVTAVAVPRRGCRQCQPQCARVAHESGSNPVTPHAAGRHRILDGRGWRATAGRNLRAHHAPRPTPDKPHLPRLIARIKSVWAGHATYRSRAHFLLLGAGSGGQRRWGGSRVLMVCLL